MALFGAILIGLWTHLNRGNALRPSENLVAHAGGAVRGATYTNSLEALNLSFSRRFGLIEIDFQWTTDGHLVLLHDWESGLEANYDAPRGRRSLRDFMTLKMKRGLTQMSIETLFAWLDRHPGADIVTDVKSQNLKALRFIQKNYSNFSQRFVPQIYSFEEYPEAKRLGYQRIILTLYRTSATDSSVIEFCRGVDLFAVTMWRDRALKSGLPAKLSQLGIPVFAHTLNQQADVDALIRVGTFGVYTDYLHPRD